MNIRAGPLSLVWSKLSQVNSAFPTNWDAESTFLSFAASPSVLSLEKLGQGHALLRSEFEALKEVGPKWISTGEEDIEDLGEEIFGNFAKIRHM